MCFFLSLCQCLSPCHFSLFRKKISSYLSPSPMLTVETDIQFFKWVNLMIACGCFWALHFKRNTKSTINPVSERRGIDKFRSVSVRIGTWYKSFVCLKFGSQTQTHAHNKRWWWWWDSENKEKTWYLNLCLSVHHQYGIQMRCESGRHPFYVLFFFCIQFAIWMFCKSTNGYWKDAMQNNKCEVEISVFVLAVWVLSMCPHPHTRDRPIQNATFYKTIFITYNTCLCRLPVARLPFCFV